MTIASPISRASGTSTPWPIRSRHHATDIAMVATIDRSMPRPMIVSAMPMPRMPRMETFWISERILSVVRKLLRRIENATNKMVAIAKTMRS